jgi:thioredoxin-dependent peroxiredoxin
MKLLSLLTLFVFSSAGASAALQKGDSAPDFTLPDAEGKNHTLSNYRGNIVVLYFYPKNNTPGCTKQGCSIRDGYAELRERGVTVLGISYDSPESHRKFAEKHSFPFTLLSDSSKKVAKSYDAAGTVFAKRITYIIDPDGKILEIITKVDTSGHAEQILSFLPDSD